MAFLGWICADAKQLQVIGLKHLENFVHLQTSICYYFADIRWCWLWCWNWKLSSTNSTWPSWHSSIWQRAQEWKKHIEMQTSNPVHMSCALFLCYPVKVPGCFPENEWEQKWALAGVLLAQDSHWGFFLVVKDRTCGLSSLSESSLWTEKDCIWFYEGFLEPYAAAALPRRTSRYTSHEQEAAVPCFTRVCLVRLHLYMQPQVVHTSIIIAVVKLIIILNYNSSWKWQLSRIRTCKLVIDGSRSMGSRQRKAVRSSFSALPRSMGFPEKEVARNGQVNSLDGPWSDVADILVLNLTIGVEEQTRRNK